MNSLRGQADLFCALLVGLSTESPARRTYAATKLKEMIEGEELFHKACILANDLILAQVEDSETGVFGVRLYYPDKEGTVIRKAWISIGPDGVLRAILTGKDLVSSSGVPPNASPPLSPDQATQQRRIPVEIPQGNSPDSELGTRQRLLIVKNELEKHMSHDDAMDVMRVLLDLDDKMGGRVGEHLTSLLAALTQKLGEDYAVLVMRRLLVLRDGSQALGVRVGSVSRVQTGEERFFIDKIQGSIVRPLDSDELAYLITPYAKAEVESDVFGEFVFRCSLALNQAYAAYVGQDRAKAKQWEGNMTVMLNASQELGGLTPLTFIVAKCFAERRQRSGCVATAGLLLAAFTASAVVMISAVIVH